MPKNPSTQWFWNDWRLDTGVHACSIGARGLWFEMLGICAENGGYLLIGGKPASLCALAREVGVDRRAISRLLKELERNGVFSRTEEGTIFNRRMVREKDARTPRRGCTKTPVIAYPLDNDKRQKTFDNFEKTRTRARVLQASILSESLCVESKTPKPRAGTQARARARTHKNLSQNINGKDKGWHDQYIDIGRKAAFTVERT